MSIQEIERAIPHRPPMLLLDEIISRDEATIVCRKTFSADDFFVQGHFPGQPLVPGVIQCECCLQAGAVLLQQFISSDSAGDSAGVPVVTRMDSVKFKRMVRPGDTIEIHVALKETLSNAFFMTGKVLLDGKPTTRLEFACSVANAAPPSGEAS